MTVHCHAVMASAMMFSILSSSYNQHYHSTFSLDFAIPRICFTNFKLMDDIDINSKQFMLLATV